MFFFNKLYLALFIHLLHIMIGYPQYTIALLPVSVRQSIRPCLWRWVTEGAPSLSQTTYMPRPLLATASMGLNSLYWSYLRFRSLK